MDSQKIVLRETATIAIGELICSAIMVGVFAALGHFQWNVVWSALAGSVIMTLNFFFMAITVTSASANVTQEEIAQAQKRIQLSSTLRLLVMGGALVLGILLGGNVIALVLPLAFARPTIMVAEFFRKKGD